jgi:hypothetical protein
MPNGTNDHGFVVDDLEQGHAAGMAVPNEFPQERARAYFRQVNGKRSKSLRPPSMALTASSAKPGSPPRINSRSKTTLNRPCEISLRCLGEQNSEPHRPADILSLRLAFAFSRRWRNSAITSCASQWRPDCFAASGDASPRAINADGSKRILTALRTEASTNADSDSPSCSTRSRCSRHSGCTRTAAMVDDHHRSDRVQLVHHAHARPARDRTRRRRGAGDAPES